MIKVTVDLSTIKNQIAIIHNEAFSALEKNDNDRRAALGRIVEQLNTIKARLSADSTTVEVK